MEFLIINYFPMKHHSPLFPSGQGHDEFYDRYMRAVKRAQPYTFSNQQSLAMGQGRPDCTHAGNIRRRHIKPYYYIPVDVGRLIPINDRAVWKSYYILRADLTAEKLENAFKNVGYQQ